MSRLKKYMVIIFGTFVMAVGIDVFLLPAKISSGGINTIGTVLLYLFGVPLSVTNILLNLVLFVFGYKYLGKESTIKTAAGILLLSFFLEIVRPIPHYSGDIFISAAAGGILMGIGLGMIIRVEASTGGSDFAGMILHRFFPHISVAGFIAVIDCVIISVSGLIFKSLTVTGYSFLALFLAAKVADSLLSMGDAAKSVYILSAKSRELAKIITENINRGATGIYCRGMYTDTEGLMLLCVVNPKELPRLTAYVRKIDPDAFIIICDAKEVLGEGFKTDTA